MPKINEIRGREILDSRGNPTVEADLVMSDGSFGRASVPSGASTGSFEALELRDNDMRRYLGKGVTRCVENIEKVIFPKVKGMESGRQRELDLTLCELDGTPNKGRLGANAILAVSLAYAKASAAARKVQLYRYIAGLAGKEGKILPTPMMNIINGGRHADNKLDIQEFMIIPLGAASFSDALRMGCEVFQNLKKVLSARKLTVAVGDEGGFAPQIGSAEEAISLILEAISKSGHKVGDDIALGLDVAATEFYKDGNYAFHGEDGLITKAGGLIEYYNGISNSYPIVFIEDGLAEDDWKGWEMLTASLGNRLQLVGDDIFVTNTERLERGIGEKVANAILIKVNQIGTLSETLQAIEMAQKGGYGVVVSHRSGETEDSTIADLAVGAECGQIKTGSLSRSDRTAKYNQLLRIEGELGGSARYAGRAPFL